MYISSFRVSNYKSFHESEVVQFGPGFNLIVGANNAGKTALLEALSLRGGSNPHRSPKTVPFPDANPDSTSRLEVSITVSRDELLDFLQIENKAYFSIPLANYDTDIAKRTLLQKNDVAALQRFVDDVFGGPSLTFRLKRGGAEAWRTASLPSFTDYQLIHTTDAEKPGMTFKIDRERSLKAIGGCRVHDGSEVGAILAQVFERHIYRFSAERYNIGACAFGNRTELASNAHNLPEVLTSLQANPARFEEFNRLVLDIFPHVRQVSVQPSGNSEVEIRIWVFDPESKRLDLARPLKESGTGIAQVLAVLYVALNSVRPQVIIIDEPQSFLHPGAIRKLIDVLRRQTRHQYILATHSPAVITASNPSSITLVRLIDGESHLESVDARETKAATACLSEIGARLSDVFGADNFLWVEGATEETCFPMILAKAGVPLMGTAIVGVRQVGDFEGRDAKRILEIYNRLSQSKSLIPPAVAFIFDEECRTTDQKNGLSKLGKGRVFFLPRRMFENYLLNPSAIASVINEFDHDRARPAEAQEVRLLIDQLRADERFFRPASVDCDADWVCHVHAGRLLDAVFKQISEARVEFEKPEHSVELATWILEHTPNEFDEIVALLDAALKK